ncbi:hypothetical protein [Melaminivora alkalimesophila]|uniref:Uncharacterized protein n=1 Tax=Melaminivora alkalimesophila TaxID=1165852 RepID=A0A317RDW5_9BURK|nr:hypothetical protein [Melaminivora alkalimesophila]PWW47771.1 hypothetical protein DFR36_102147 [Melaminivora alkalimesophila]
MRRNRLRERLLGLFAAGWLLLNFPLFSIWDREQFVLGWPLLPAAAFAIWLLLIVALAVLVERGRSRGAAGGARAQPPGDG